MGTFHLHPWKNLLEEKNFAWVPKAFAAARKVIISISWYFLEYKLCKLRSANKFYNWTYWINAGGKNSHIRHLCLCRKKIALQEGNNIWGNLVAKDRIQLRYTISLKICCCNAKKFFEIVNTSSGLPFLTMYRLFCETGCQERESKF